MAYAIIFREFGSFAIKEQNLTAFSQFRCRQPTGVSGLAYVNSALTTQFTDARNSDGVAIAIDRVTDSAL